VNPASRIATTPTRMRPAGPRGVASTRASRSRIDATNATASAASRRDPDAYVVGLSPRDHASTRRTPRPVLRCGANQRRTSWASPRGPAGRFVWSSKNLRARDARRPCTKRPTRGRAPSPSKRASRFATTPTRTRPAGPRGVASTRASRSRSDATNATTSAASRREPDAYVASFSPRTCRMLRVDLEGACEHATLVGHARRGRRAAEHRLRARGRRESRPRRRECARQVRGELRAHEPRDHASTRRTPRPPLRRGANQTRTS
jgi:hypothetical protein